MAGASIGKRLVPQTVDRPPARRRCGHCYRQLNCRYRRLIGKYTSQGGKFSIDVTRDGADVLVKVTGASAHGSRPEEGVNPLPRLALFLQQSGVALVANKYAQAALHRRPVMAWTTWPHLGLTAMTAWAR